MARHPAVRRRKALRLVALAAIMVAGLAVPSWLGGRQRSGQQRHGQDRHHPFDDLPDNQPHVGCSFQVDAEGSQGADVKHKVFWVTGGGVQAFTGGGLTLPMLLAAVALLGLGAASLLTGSRRRRRAKASM